MSTKSIGYALIVLGAIVLVVSLLADVIGVGQHPWEIGWVQYLGAAIGLIIAVVGAVFAMRKT